MCIDMRTFPEFKHNSLTPAEETLTMEWKEINIEIGEA